MSFLGHTEGGKREISGITLQKNKLLARLTGYSG